MRLCAVIFILLLADWLRGQVDTPPATLQEAGAGRVKYKYISPYTLAGGTETATARTLTFNPTNVWNDITFSLSDLDPIGAATGPTPTIVGNRLFQVFGAGNVSFVNAQMPHEWRTNTPVRPHFHYVTQTATALTNTWEVIYATGDIGGVFTAETILTNTIVIPAGASNRHVLVNLPTNGIPMPHVGPSTVATIRYRFLSGNLNAYISNFDVHYQVGGSPVPYNP